MRTIEVIKALIDHLAQGLQKWVGWQDKDECCLGQKSKGNRNGGTNKSKGIGGDCLVCGYTVNPVPCACPGCPTVCCSKGRGCSGSCTSSEKCCSTNSGTSACAECKKGFGCCHCAIKPEDCQKSGCYCYLSAYSKTTALWTNIVNGTPGSTTITTNDPSKVHLLARIFLGSVCLIWSGLSQLGFLTGKSNDRWSNNGKLHEENNGLGSFMAAMGYDLDRLNGSGSKGEYCLG